MREVILYFWSMEHFALIFYCEGNSVLAPMKENLKRKEKNGLAWDSNSHV